MIELRYHQSSMRALSLRTLLLLSLAAVCAIGSQPPQLTSGTSHQPRSRKPLAILRDSKHSCGSEEYKCTNGMCILAKWRFDGYDDCGDYSDEYKQEKGCPTDRFDCLNGQCISKEFICDGDRDCKNNVDEKNCGNDSDMSTESDCPEFRFRCKNGTCVDNDKLCDNEGVSSSEEDKSMAVDAPQADVPAYPTSFHSGCYPNQWQCRSGECIEWRQRCDRNYNCEDYSDEAECGPAMRGFPTQAQFTSSGSQVDLRVYDTPQTQMVGYDVVFRCRDEGPLRLPVSWRRANGAPFPPKTTDVNGRLTMYNITATEAGSYICQVQGENISKEGHLSVTTRPLDGGRTGRVNYGNNYYGIGGGGEIESLRRPLMSEICAPNQIKCRNGNCISRDAVCNGVKDCTDASDENSCPIKCKYDEFKCDSNQCVRKTQRCDGHKHCWDGSDERNCGKNVVHDGCHYNEWACVAGGGCVPDVYRCDGYFDCKDQSDELRCQSPRIVDVPPIVSQVEEGSSLTLNCTASGYPVPTIVWRYNMDYMGHSTGSKITFCTTTCDECPSNVVVGSITIRDLQVSDEGMYTCEAVNQQKSILATTDTLVHVTPRRHSRRNN